MMGASAAAPTVLKLTEKGHVEVPTAKHFTAADIRQRQREMGEEVNIRCRGGSFPAAVSPRNIAAASMEYIPKIYSQKLLEQFYKKTMFGEMI